MTPHGTEDRRTPISIVVPTYNERARLTELVEAIAAVFAAHAVDGEIIVVDDHSPDGTGELADRLSERLPVRVVHRAGKLGLGSAVVEGAAVARHAIIGVMDADLSHPPDLLPGLLDVMRGTGSDIVVGSRYIKGGGTRHWPIGRLFLSRIACLLAAPLTPVRDATSGFFLIRREIVRAVRISAAGFKICLELLVRGEPRSVAEVPYVFVGRVAGESKMNVGEALGYLRQLWDLYRLRVLTRGAARRPAYRRIAVAGAATSQKVS